MIKTEDQKYREKPIILNIRLASGSYFYIIIERKDMISNNDSDGESDGEFYG